MTTHTVIGRDRIGWNTVWQPPDERVPVRRDGESATLVVRHGACPTGRRSETVSEPKVRRRIIDLQTEDRDARKALLQTLFDLRATTSSLEQVGVALGTTPGSVWKFEHHTNPNPTILATQRYSRA